MQISRLQGRLAALPLLPALLLVLGCAFVFYVSTWSFWGQEQDRWGRRSIHMRTSESSNNSTDVCAGHEKILEIVNASGYSLDNRTRNLLCTMMPSWDEVARLYGDKPKIIGLETCQKYRDKIRERNNQQSTTNETTTVYPMPRVAGLENCGTTAMAVTLQTNLVVNPTIHSENPRAYNVPWRKHTSIKYKYNSTTLNHGWIEDKDLVFPVVVVRDPYRWMGSMCKIPYRVQWDFSNRHCPNLVAYPEPGREGIEPVPVRVHLLLDPNWTIVHYNSLVHLWSGKQHA
jgi:hypothetical protein